MATAKQVAAFHREFWRLVFNEHSDTHIRMPNVPGCWVTLIGHAKDLHGPSGSCACCPRATMTTESEGAA